MDIRTKRVYDPPDPQDGKRLLVDRVWPRGLSKAQVQADEWLREVAPSTELRQWFNHDPAKWDEFKRRYFAELEGKQEAVARLRAVERRLTLLYSAKDEARNQAVALKEYLEGK